MRPRLLLALLVLAGCSVDCNPDRSPTFPSAATATDSPICLPTGYTVVGVDIERIAQARDSAKARAAACRAMAGALAALLPKPADEPAQEAA